MYDRSKGTEQFYDCTLPADRTAPITFWLREKTDLPFVDVKMPDGHVVRSICGETVSVYLAKGGTVLPDTVPQTLPDLPPSLSATPNIPLDRQTLDQLRAERDYWDREFATAPGFPSAITALNFRDACDVWIKRREAERYAYDPKSVQTVTVAGVHKTVPNPDWRWWTFWRPRTVRSDELQVFNVTERGE